MEPTDRTCAGYDRVAAKYAAELGQELASKPLGRALLDAFAELAADPVLDVGGAPGYVAERLAEQGLAVVHTDLSPRMCALAGRRRTPRSGACCGQVASR